MFLCGFMLGVCLGRSGVSLGSGVVSILPSMVGVGLDRCRVRGLQEKQGYRTSTMATHSLTQDEFILAVESKDCNTDADVLRGHFGCENFG
jgi:hypothetical protein